MKKLVELEWLKFRKNTGVRIGLIMYVFLMPSAYFFIRTVGELSQNPLVNLKALSEFPMIWHSMAYGANWLAFFIMGYIGIQLISVEFANKTFRQNVISGLSRVDFVKSKLLSAFILTIFALIVYVFWIMILGSIYTETPFELFGEQGAWIILRFILMNFGYIIMAMSVAFLFKGSNLGLFAYFLYGMFIENLIRWWPHTKLINNKSMHFYPMNALEDLTPQPYFAQLTKMGNVGFDLLLTPAEATITAIVYTSLFILVMFYLATKRDI
jgi:ABC-2 type transport system permease protein